MLPYPINCFTSYFTSFDFNIFINIIPASEPTGVSKAHIFDAATTPKTIFIFAENVERAIVKNIVIGILFNRFPSAKAISPTTNIF